MVGAKRRVVNIIANPSIPHWQTCCIPTQSIGGGRLSGAAIAGTVHCFIADGLGDHKWDYTTALFHVSKRSAEYYKGVTPIQSSNWRKPNPAPTSSTASQHPSAFSNHYGLNLSLSQLSSNHQNNLKNGSINVPAPSHTSNLNPTTQFPPL
ncbi:hypothetical protein PCANC_01286 [Puccinia coronata f. sp. avenae]|uniref:Uncharacterized protein n=1 Tax=Puccinia coronata f. sp. avenae TaxID=200324 RepID=A0A2N5W3S4_9BASI|nr:hypothetical protein PCANC_01286 [Puccinia coronata f. sp. avenae]